MEVVINKFALLFKKSSPFAFHYATPFYIFSPNLINLFLSFSLSSLLLSLTNVLGFLLLFSPHIFIHKLMCNLSTL